MGDVYSLFYEVGDVYFITEGRTIITTEEPNPCTLTEDPQQYAHPRAHYRIFRPYLHCVMSFRSPLYTQNKVRSRT